MNKKETIGDCLLICDKRQECPSLQRLAPRTTCDRFPRGLA